MASLAHARQAHTAPATCGLQHRPQARAGAQHQPVRTVPGAKLSLQKTSNSKFPRPLSSSASPATSAPANGVHVDRAANHSRHRQREEHAHHQRPKHPRHIDGGSRHQEAPAEVAADEGNEVSYSPVQKVVLGSALLQGFSVFGVGSILTTLYMTETLGFGSVEIGVMIASGSVGALVGTMFAGLASQRGISNGKLFSGFAALCLLGSLLFCFSDPLLPPDQRTINLYLHYLGNLFISGGVSGLLTLTGPMLTAQGEDQEHANAARLSTLNTLMPAGALLGSLVGGRAPSWLLTHYTTINPEASAYIGDYYQPTLMCYPVSYGLMLALSLWVFSRSERDKRRRELQQQRQQTRYQLEHQEGPAVQVLRAKGTASASDGDYASLGLIFSATFFVAVSNATTFLGSYYLSENYAKSAATIGVVYFIKESLAIPAGYSGQFFIDSFGTKAVLVASSLSLSAVACATGLVDSFELYALLLIANVCVSKLFSTSSTNYALSRVAPEHRTLCSAVQGAGLCLSGVALGASGFIMKAVGSTGFFIGSGVVGAVGGWLWFLL